MKKSLLLATVLSCSAVAVTAHAQNRGVESGAAIPRCTQNIGTVVVVESQSDMFRHMNMGTSADFLKFVVRESGCFSLIQRIPGSPPPATARRVEFAISANLTNEVNLGDGRTGVLGVVGRNRATRYLADRALESTTGGLMNMDRLNEGVDMAHDGRLEAAIEAVAEVTVMATGAVVAGAGYVMEETASTADSYNRALAASGASNPRQNMEMATATAGTRVAGRTFSAAGRAMMEPTDPNMRREMDARMEAMGFGQPSMGQMINQMPGARLMGLGGRKSDEEILREAMQDLKKDMGRGKIDAQIEMSLVSIPLAEIVAETGNTTGKDDVRRMRVANNTFGGRAGRGWEDSDEGKAMAVAIIKSYTDMVTQLGGMGHSTPEITLATRDAIRRSEEESRRRAEFEAEAARPRRPEPRSQLRQASRPAARSAQPPQAEVIRNTILRDAPAGRVVIQLTAGSTVYPTGEIEEGWLEIEDDAGNSGWVQADRIMDLD